MANKLPDTTGLITFHKNRTEAKIARVRKMIQHSLEYNEEINVNAIAKKAGVSRWFIYSIEELKNEINGLRETALIRSRKKQEQMKASSSFASSMAKVKTLQAKCYSLQKEVEKLNIENKRLKEYIEAKCI